MGAEAHDVYLSHSGAQIIQSTRESKGKQEGIDSGCRVADKSMLTYVIWFYRR